AVVAPAVAQSKRPRVVIVLIDGLDASRVGPELMPTLWALAHGHGGSATFYPNGRAVMPTVTNTNHASILTGTYRAAHGIVGNEIPNRDGGEPIATERGDFLEVETLFTVIEHDRPGIVTAAFFGKARLAGFFAAEPGRQRRPDFLWGDPETESEPIDPERGFRSDARRLDAAPESLAAEAPAFLLVAPPDVDRTAHVFGPSSVQARRAELEADRQFGRLVQQLMRRGLWDETVLMVTADHGMQSIEPTVDVPYPVFSFGRELRRSGLAATVVLQAHGGIESVALHGRPPERLDEHGAVLLARGRAL